MENSKTVSRKSGRGRPREVVVHERFQYETLTANIFWCFGKVVAYGSRLREVVARGSSTVFGFWSA